jgi:hypothetical protein
MPLPGKPLTARFADEHSAGILLITIESPAQIIALNLANRTIIGRTPLPGPAVDLDVNGQNAAVAIPSQRAIVRLSATNLKVAGTTSVGVPCQLLRFRNDGRTILAGSADARQVVTVDVASGALLARLPLPLAPSHFCFNSDGGQMFVTGAGQDSVTIVSPYQNEVGETMLAGRTPDAMAISVPRNLLLVTNRETGDLTILDIETRHLSASVHVGGVPGEVMVTPDGEYALVLDRASGSVSVVRLDTVLEPNKGDAPAAVVQLRTKPLFTTFATAGDARSALIVPSPVA